MTGDLFFLVVLPSGVHTLALLNEILLQKQKKNNINQQYVTEN